MRSLFKKGYRQELLYLVTVVSIIVVMFMHFSSVQRQMVEASAYTNARNLSEALASFRNYYASKIVTVAKRHGIEITHEHGGAVDAIPLPATMSMELGRLIGRQVGGASSHLYSPYPFKWRLDDDSGGLEDDFQHQAWSALQSNRDEPYTRIESAQGERYLRYASADVMTEDCVGCHNGRADSPKRDWKVGDLRGVLEVRVPLGILDAESKLVLKTTSLLYSGIALVLIGGFLHSLWRRRSQERWLESRVANRTAALSQEMEKQRAVADALEIARQEAEAANRAKSEFLARMSHELRTPMNAVLGFAQVLELDLEDEEQRDRVREILKAGHHLMELIGEVLDLSAIESGKLSVTSEAVELKSILDECQPLIQQLADGRGITLRLPQGKEADVCVVGDPLRVRQVVINLLSNAIKYNCEGGAVEVAFSPAPEGRLRVTVSDSGEGLSESDRLRLFQPFERLNQKFVDGVGIGLVVTKQLVELMGGVIGVDSRVGEGSCFWFELARA